MAADGDNVEIVRCLVGVEEADINIKGGKGVSTFQMEIIYASLFVK